MSITWFSLKVFWWTITRNKAALQRELDTLEHEYQKLSKKRQN